MKKVLFIRNYKNFTGGHLKVWHYYNHLKNSNNFEPYIYFTQGSVWDDSNPFLPIKEEILDCKDSIDPDIVFLAGLDWLQWQVNPVNVPVINFIQHIRHANPNSKLFKFLKNKAIRICVSKEVENALVESKQVNGPIYTIPNGIDVPMFPLAVNYQDKKYDVLILGLKNIDFAERLYKILIKLDIKIKILTHKIPQKQYLEELNQSKVSVFLPHKTEGFYLPALESMALDSLVICPDCIGNRGFCLPNINCIQPKYTLEDVIFSVKRALSLNSSDISNILNNAKATLQNHTLENEKNLFIDIINNTDQIW